jgi:import receptor subunit TOM20
VEKAVAQSKETELAASTSDITRAALRDVLQQVKTEEAPKTPEEKENYFMTQVNAGEQLALQGVYRFLVLSD